MNIPSSTYCREHTPTITRSKIFTTCRTKTGFQYIPTVVCIGTTHYNILLAVRQQLQATDSLCSTRISGTLVLSFFLIVHKSSRNSMLLGKSSFVIQLRFNIDLLCTTACTYRCFSKRTTFCK